MTYQLPVNDNGRSVLRISRILVHPNIQDKSSLPLPEKTLHPVEQVAAGSRNRLLEIVPLR